MRTIAPINSGFLLNIALLILCLACTHANGEVNSKELLGDVGFDLEANDVESTSTIATQTTTDHNGGGCRDKHHQCRASWFNNCNDQYWRGQCPKKCGVCSGSHSHNPHRHTPHSHTPHSHSNSGGQQADEQTDGCFFCGKPCPKDCWNAMKRRVDEGGTIDDLYGFPRTLKECQKAENAITAGRGNPRVIYYEALVKMGKKYYADRKSNVDWSPDGGWLKYGLNKKSYCWDYGCGPNDYAKYGPSSPLGCENTCSSFPNPENCKVAAPNCKWMGWGQGCRSVNVDQAELLQTTDSTANKTETSQLYSMNLAGLTNVQQSMLDRLLDDVQIEANRQGGASVGCW